MQVEARSVLLIASGARAGLVVRACARAQVPTELAEERRRSWAYGGGSGGGWGGGGAAWGTARSWRARARRALVPSLALATWVGAMAALHAVGAVVGVVLHVHHTAVAPLPAAAEGSESASVFGESVGPVWRAWDRVTRSRLLTSCSP